MARRVKKSYSYTAIIIGINIVAFLLFLVLSYSYGDVTISNLALQPKSSLTKPLTFLTSMLMHAGLGHLFVNIVSLVFLGGFIEKLVGKKRFLYLYLASGLFAGIFFVAASYIFGLELNVYAVGASGAIFGLGGLLAVLTPRLPVLVFFIIPMPMWAAMVFLMFGLWALSLTLGLPIGNLAHLGGLLVGLGYGFYLKKKYPHKSRMINRYFS